MYNKYPHYAYSKVSYDDKNKEIEQFYDEYPDYYTNIYSTCFFKSFFFLFSFFVFSFFIFNLIFSYSYIEITDRYCVTIDDKTFKLTLEKWLLITSYSSVGFYFLFLGTLYLYSKLKSNTPLNIKILFSFKYLSIFFNIIMLFWSICGLYMFITSFQSNCKSKFLNIYIWINTIINMVIHIFLLVFMYFL